MRIGRSFALLTVGATCFIASVSDAQSPPGVNPPPGAPGSGPTTGKMPSRPAPPPQDPNRVGTILFETKIGSFKLLQPGETPCRGRMEVSFTGTMLISGLKGTITPTGRLRREYKNDKWNRQVWFGTGKMVIEGQFEAVQWFGRNMSGKFTGMGIFRFFGEFDENQKTGTWRWADRAQVNPWFNSGVNISVPRDERFEPTKPVPRPRT